jgi:hypothetical protein
VTLRDPVSAARAVGRPARGTVAALCRRVCRICRLQPDDYRVHADAAARRYRHDPSQRLDFDPHDSTRCPALRPPLRAIRRLAGFPAAIIVKLPLFVLGSVAIVAAVLVAVLI